MLKGSSSHRGEITLGNFRNKLNFIEILIELKIELNSKETFRLSDSPLHYFSNLFSSWKRIPRLA